MKAIFAFIFSTVLLVLLICIAETVKCKKTIAKTVRSILVMGAVATAANIVLMLTENLMICSAAYSVFFCSISWLMYFMLKFVHEYTGGTGSYRSYKNLLILILVVDNLFMFANLIFNNVFAVELRTWHGETYVSAVHKTLYNVHLCLAYLIAAVFFFLLIRKTYKSPAMYRKKYEYILCALLFVFLADAIFVFTDMEIDFSIIIYAVVGIVIYYCSLIYTPKDLIDTTLSMVVEDTVMAMLLFDIDGNCILENKSAKELLIDESGNTLDMEPLFRDWCKEQPPQEREDYVRDSTEERGDKQIRVRIRFHKLMDRSGNYLGCYFELQDRTEEDEELEKKRYLTTHDNLTGLYNREYFYEKVREKINEQPQETYIMMCTNLTKFKMVNDIFGEKTGDELIKRLADAMRRHADINTVFARLEGDRFALFMKKSEYSEEIFIHNTWEAVRVNGGTYPVQNCMGVYIVEDNNMPVSVMCERASMAITTIKGSYDKTIVYYDKKLHDSIVRERKMISQMQEAIDKGQFEIYLQPQIYYRNGIASLCGAEALVRWHHQKGLIPPGEFIEVFEQNGLITKLDMHVWRLACAQLKKWKEEKRTDLTISVNISPRDFYFTDVYRVFTGLVEEFEILPKNLKLEITETAIMLDVEKQIILIERLKNAGFTVEMDDFGSGYSSLNTLKDIPVDVIKIDMKFLEKGRYAGRNKKIIRTIVSMAQHLDIGVITEGVETKAQADFIDSIGCHMIQGFYFAKPMRIDEFEQKYFNSETEQQGEL